MQIKFDNVSKSLFLCGWAALVACGVSGYSGSWWLYVIFSLASLSMLWVAFYKVFNYSYFFLSAFLFLGFWAKLTFHLIFPAPFIEPVGAFSSLPAAWDEVLWVATASAMALVAVKLAWVWLQGAAQSCNAINDAVVVPTWFVVRRKFLWSGVVVLIPLVAVINAELGIHQIGLAPRTILIFPINAVIAWMLNYGLVTIIATILWWDALRHRASLLSMHVALFEALFSGVSMLSRGAFIFHIAPLFIAYYRNHLRFKTPPSWQILSILLVGAIFFLIGLAAVDMLRGHYYRSEPQSLSQNNQQNVVSQNIQQPEKELLGGDHEKTLIKREASAKDERDAIEKGEKSNDAQVSNQLRLFQDAVQAIAQKIKVLGAEFWIQWPAMLNRALSLAADRWIGLEGVMALQSYPDKSMALLHEGLTERYADGVVPMYQHISKSIYTGMDPNQWKFGSLPGAAAFFYYSGSLLIVFLGMAAMTICILIFEYAVRRWTQNPFLTSFYGFVAANFVAQFGVVPRQILPVMVTLLCGIACVSFLQRVRR